MTALQTDIADRTTSASSNEDPSTDRVTKEGDHFLDSMHVGVIDLKQINPEYARINDRNLESQCSHWIAQQLTKTVFGVAEDEFCILKDSAGKPTISQHESINLSISHSSSIATAALASSAIGIDIEDLDTISSHFREVITVFDKAPQADILEEDQAPEISFGLAWTASESAAKLLQCNLDDCLSHFRFLQSPIEIAPSNHFLHWKSSLAHHLSLLYKNSSVMTLSSKQKMTTTFADLTADYIRSNIQS